MTPGPNISSIADNVQQGGTVTKTIAIEWLSVAIDELQMQFREQERERLNLQADSTSVLADFLMIEFTALTSSVLSVSVAEVLAGVPSSGMLITCVFDADGFEPIAPEDLVETLALHIGY